MTKSSWELYGIQHLKRELEQRAALQDAAQENNDGPLGDERPIVWRQTAAQGLARLSYEQRLAVERAVEGLRAAPDRGHEVENACCSTAQEILAGGYRIFYLLHSGSIEITGLRRA